MDRRTVRFYDGVARRLRAAIRRSGRSQASLAELAGVSQAHLSRFLARTAISLRADVLWKLAIELGLDPAELLQARERRRTKAGKR